MNEVPLHVTLIAVESLPRLGLFLMSEVLLYVTLLAVEPRPARGTSIIRNNPLRGPYSRTMSRAVWWP